MRWMGLVVAASLAGSGCSENTSNEGEHGNFVARQEGFSCDRPPDWTLTRDRGAVMFTSHADTRRTIAIRSVPIPRGGSSEKIVADTEVVLRALPAAALAATHELEGGMPATEYPLTFEPPTVRERFTRRHVIVRGRKHVFHVIETLPASSKSDDAVMNIVASMREEA